MRFIIISAVMTFSLFTLCHDSINAQSGGMNRQYFFDDRSTIFNSVIEFEGELVVLGQSGTDSSGFTSVFILRLDTLGNIKKLNFYQDPNLADHVLLSSYSYDAMGRSQDGVLVLFGSMFSSNNLYMIKLDSTLELQFFKEYESDFLFRSTNDLVMLDSFYYVIGLVENGPLNVDIFIQKLDLEGNKIWEKIFGTPTYYDVGLSGITEDKGITILGSESYDPNQLQYNDEHSWTKIFHIDTSGEVIWLWKSEDNEEGRSPSGLIKIDGTYIYTTIPSFQVNIQTIWRAAQIVCRDELFDIKWRKTYSDTFHINSFTDITIGADGNLFTTGQIFDEFTWASVYNIDQQNGDVNWSARDTGIYIPGYGSRNVMESIIELPSGSLIAVGYTFDANAFKEHGLLIKVNKDGCIDTLCTTSLIENTQLGNQKNIEVFPNPAFEYINVSLINSTSSCNITIYDLNGKVLLRQELFPGKNVIYFDEKINYSGLFLWTLVNNTGYLTHFGKFLVIR